MSNVTIHDVLENIRTSDDKTGLPPFLIKKLSNFCFNYYNMLKEVGDSTLSIIHPIHSLMDPSNPSTSKKLS
jgi:hypothetical protein